MIEKPGVKSLLRGIIMPIVNKLRVKAYYKNGQIPWSKGYHEAKVQAINRNILSDEVLKSFKARKLPPSYGYRMDERLVEYPWLISSLSEGRIRLLDAGSTFNYDYLISHPRIANKDLTIYTYYPERTSYPERRINYEYGDLRELPFKENHFDQIICQSTIEHIDMDNSMYGYEIKNSGGLQTKSYEYMKVIHELYRILKNRGVLLLTFPYGKFENHGFFQQFDTEMLDRIILFFTGKGTINEDFFSYSPEGWQFSNREASSEAESHNPHTGIGKKDDFAAHSRAICCIKFEKNS